MTTARAREKRRDSYWRRKLREAREPPGPGSDGCTFSPDTLVVTRKNIDGVRETRAVSVTQCCVTHDRGYEEHQIDGADATRREVDQKFRACLRCRIGAMRASVYYYAVRAFGARRWSA